MGKKEKLQFGPTGPFLKGRYSFALICSLLLTSTCFGARKGQLDFVKQTDLPDLGLSLRIMSEAAGVPIPPPSAYTYRYRRGDKTWTEERFLPVDLWRQRQHAVTWRDKHMNTLTIARIRELLPTTFTGKHVARKVFEEVIQASTSTEWTPDALTAWTSSFLGVAHVSATQVTQRNRRLKDLVAFSFTSEETTGRERAYAFRATRPAFAKNPHGDQWYFLLITIAQNVDIERAVRNIQQKLLLSLGTPRVGSSSRKNGQNRFQNPKMLPVDPAGPDTASSRTQAIAGIRNMAGWWYAETPNYVFLSNLRSRFKVMVRDLQENIEKLRTIYEHLIPAKKTITAVSTIKVFESEEEYATYVPRNYRWTYGLWMPEKQELVVRRVDWGGSRDQRKLLEKAVYHEAFHQYLYYAFDRATPSAWYNEGHACFFENARASRSGISIEEDSLRMAVLEKLLRASGSIRLSFLFQASYQQFYAGDSAELRQINYVLAWAVVYYLRKGAPLDARSGFKDALARYEATFRTTLDPRKATAAAFPPSSIQRFEAEFTKFWKSKRRRANARRNRLFREK